MTDPRTKKLADILVNYSINVKTGNTILIRFHVDAKPLALECYKLILKKGAYAKLKPIVDGFSYEFYKNASETQLNHVSKMEKYESKNIDGHIFIGGDYNTKEFSNIDPKKVATRRKVLNPILKARLKKDNWVLCKYPTHALAQDAEMSLSEFEDFLYKATNIEWKKEIKFQKKIKAYLDKAKHVRITCKDTDIEFSIKGRQGIMCCGERNMPDGEVFIAPVEKSTNGKISYSFPAIYGGKEVTGIKLEFKAGKVIKATAEKNQALLEKMISIDKGAKFLGEFGIGLNKGLNKFTRQILFDEKMGGTIHLALGMAYKEGGGKNDSALHWDMIKDLRKGGIIYLDGKIFQKNGKFVF
ncbi:aminopeptidase [Candidatus Woesearchaeota archaeon]|nr:aminopeptidase [Candidatus Woesearchaeota archaeon]MBT6520359.1 aminopeptidase [Candidatus Woesearchaeota archaeon]MBT7368559.1 aminopeptidase [Candidatus Woesearchaeota archaeon]